MKIPTILDYKVNTSTWPLRDTNLERRRRRRRQDRAAHGDIMLHADHMKPPDMGHIFINANRNKRSVVLGLKQPEQREKLLALCKTADLLTYNISSKAMVRLALSYNTLCAVNRQLIVCGGYEYSKGGPYSDRARM